MSNDTINPDEFEEAFNPSSEPTHAPEKEVEDSDSPSIKPMPPYENYAQLDSTLWKGAVTVSTERKNFRPGMAVGICKTPGEIRHVMQHITDSDLSNDTGNAEWAESLEASMANIADNKHLDERIKEEGADWQQSLDYAGREIKAATPNMRSKGGRAQGQSAVLKVQSMIGLGSIIYAPLPHSCMYVAIKVADMSALLDLEYQLVSSKINLGRYTLGASFSSDEAARVRLCVRLVLRHAYASTLDTTDVDTLMDAIKVTDYPILLNTMAQNLFPKGYDFFQPCVKDPRQCNHVEQGRIDLSKVTFYDRSRFTDNQLKALSSPSGKRTLEEVQKLQAEHHKNVRDTFELNSSLRFKFKVPTLSQYVESSTGWFQSLINGIDESLELSTQDRNEYLRTSSHLQELCKYHHWIERISWDVEQTDLDDEGTSEGWMDSPDDIFSTLGSISASEELKDELMGAIEKYITDVTVAIVGIPDYECSNCGTKQTEDNNVSGIIPLNVTNVFTALVTLKLLQPQNTQKV